MHKTRREPNSCATPTAAFYQLDGAALKNGPRTVGQEVLLEDIADLFGLRLEAPESEQFD